jgi:hypothetical protein
MKTLFAALVASVALTSAAAAGSYDPATSSRDARLEAQLRAAPAPAEVSAVASFFDPSVNASDDRTVLWTWWAVEEELIATHDVEAGFYIPTIDRAVSERD